VRIAVAKTEFPSEDLEDPVGSVFVLVLESTAHTHRWSGADAARMK